MPRRDKQARIRKEYIYILYIHVKSGTDRERDRKGEGPQNVHELARFT